MSHSQSCVIMSHTHFGHAAQPVILCILAVSSCLPLLISMKSRFRTTARCSESDTHSRLLILSGTGQKQSILSQITGLLALNPTLASRWLTACLHQCQGPAGLAGDINDLIKLDDNYQARGQTQRLTDWTRRSRAALFHDEGHFLANNKEHEEAVNMTKRQLRKRRRRRVYWSHSGGWILQIWQ